MQTYLPLDEASAIIDRGMEMLFATVPFARDFHLGDGFDREYY